MQDFKNQLKYYQDVEKKIIHSQNQDGIWKTPILSKSIVSNVLRHIGNPLLAGCMSPNAIA